MVWGTGRILYIIYSTDNQFYYQYPIQYSLHSKVFCLMLQDIMTNLVCACARVLMTTDFPPPVGPTTMVVCRVNIVSYSWTTLSAWGEEKREKGVGEGGGGRGGVIKIIKRREERGRRKEGSKEKRRQRKEEEERRRKKGRGGQESKQMRGRRREGGKEEKEEEESGTREEKERGGS